jgi:hypothetical protein
VLLIDPIGNLFRLPPAKSPQLDWLGKFLEAHKALKCGKRNVQSFPNLINRQKRINAFNGGSQ